MLRGLRAYAQRLGRRSEVREVVLFGSLARGDWSARSDADVAVVVDERRAGDYTPEAGVGVAVDVFVYTVAEAEAWSPRFRSEIERGLVLYRRRADPELGAARAAPLP